MEPTSQVRGAHVEVSLRLREPGMVEPRIERGYGMGSPSFGDEIEPEAFIEPKIEGSMVSWSPG